MKSCHRTLCKYNEDYVCTFSTEIHNYDLCPIVAGKWDQMIDEVVKEIYGKEN